MLATQGRARLLDYGAGAAVSGRPVLFVPSLINPPRILDLATDNSLLRWLAGQGVRPLLLDWGDPRDCATAPMHGLSVAGHVEQLLLPLIAAAEAHAGRPVALAGYCLGGAMALAAAALHPVAGLALIATPWRFSAYPDAARASLAGLWREARPIAEGLGVFPMEMLQTAFWQIDPDRTFAKYAEFGQLDPDSAAAAAFVALEDWANDGPPLALAAAQELLEDFMRDDLPGQGGWHVAGKLIDPAELGMPVLNLLSETDRIAPASSAPSVGTRRMFAQGHVGMVVGGRARDNLWACLSSWLSQLQ